MQGKPYDKSHCDQMPNTYTETRKTFINPAASLHHTLNEKNTKVIFCFFYNIN